MYFSLLIMLLNSFLIHADPPGARASERTQEDQQIDDECQRELKQSLDLYAACVAAKGREAEARRMMEINEGPAQESTPQLVCNPDGAVSFCSRSSEAAARANNPSSSVQQITVALQSCRAACNPDSAIVLRNYLNGCRGDLSAQKRLMTQTMNNCGTGTVSEGVVDTIKSTVTGLADSATNYGSQAWDWLSSKTNPTISSFSATLFSDAGRSSFPAPQSEVDPLGTEWGATAPPTNAEFPQLKFSETVSGAPPAEPEYSLGTPAPTEPVAREQVPPSGGGNGGDGNGNNNGTSPNVADNDQTQQVVTPVNSNDPVSYGNYPGLQTAMASPPGGSGGSSSGGGSGSYGGEVSRGGGSSGGSYSGGSSNGASRPLAFEGSGQVAPSALRGNDTPIAPAPGASPAMDVAAPGGGSRGGGFGDFGGGGRMMAAARTGPASLESSMAAPMRSDSFYRTGSGGAVARAAVRPSAPCKGPNCPKPARARAAGIAAANCDGNPQCLLALTGKLQLPRRQGEGDILQADSGAARTVGARSGERGIASVPKRTEPGGVVRGKVLDVLNHIGSSKIFKLDHDGMLEVDL